MIDILLVTYNRIEFTKQTINSILERTVYPYRLIVVDNDSTDGTKEYLKKLKFKGDISVLILNDKNIGLEKALNKGFQIVRSTPYFITVDNDCIAPELEPCWLSRMVELMDRHEMYAAVSLRPQVLVGVGSIFKSDKEIVENNVCGGSYRIMCTNRVRLVGSWTDKFEKDGRGNEEHDICGKLRAKNWKVGYTRSLWTYHLFGDEGTWGYNKKSNYKMGRVLERSPEDQEYDPKTCEPKIKSNE